MKKFSLLLVLCVTIGVSAQDSSIGLNEESYSHSAVISNSSSSQNDFNYRFKLLREFRLNSMLKSEATVIREMEILLDLFPGKNYTANVEIVKRDINNTLVVRASLANFPGAFCILTTSANDNSSLRIEIPQLNESYTTVLDPETGLLYLAQLDLERQMEFICEPVEIDLDQSFPIDENPYLGNSSNSIAEIDVMVVYTPAAEAYALANNGGIYNVIATFMAASQTVMDNSQVDVSLNLVYSQLINYTETGSSLSDLTSLQSTDDGMMDEVHQWRNDYKADLVSLITTNQDTGGIAYVLNNPAGNPDFGFSLLNLPAIVNSSSYTPAHEMAHNMGCHHHKLQNSGPGPGLFDYSAGWRWTDMNNNRYCTIMTYTSGQYFDDGLRHNRVPYFSDPDIDFEGEQTGDAVDGDNARTIRETKHIIAAYRDALGTPHFDLEWITIAPNPTSGILRISTLTPVNRVTVFDAQGKLLQKSTSSLLDFEGYGNGIYFVQVETDKGSVVKKVIKQ